MLSFTLSFISVGSVRPVRPPIVDMNRSGFGADGLNALVAVQLLYLYPKRLLLCLPSLSFSTLPLSLSFFLSFFPSLHILHSLLSTLHSPLYSLHSALSTLHSPLSTLHSPLSTLHSPLSILYSLTLPSLSLLYSLFPQCSIALPRQLECSGHSHFSPPHLPRHHSPSLSTQFPCSPVWP